MNEVHNIISKFIRNLKMTESINTVVDNVLGKERDERGSVRQNIVISDDDLRGNIAEILRRYTTIPLLFVLCY